MSHTLIQYIHTRILVNIMSHTLSKLHSYKNILVIPVNYKYAIHMLLLKVCVYNGQLPRGICNNLPNYKYAGIVLLNLGHGTCDCVYNKNLMANCQEESAQHNSPTHSLVHHQVRSGREPIGMEV